jgi:hypothetical protein
MVFFSMPTPRKKPNLDELLTRAVEERHQRQHRWPHSQRLGSKGWNGSKPRIFSNLSSRRNHGAFRDHDHPVANEIIVAIHIFRFP